MKKNIVEKNFFTAGELAGLFGISKQTLLYYDKINLLSPDFISDNGYRHYSIEQYLDLEIIVNMRALNISIADIKHFLLHRSKENFLLQLKKKADECQKIIKENEYIYQSLQRISNNITTNDDIPLNLITITWQKQRMLRITKLTSDDNYKQRIAKFTKHSQLLRHKRKFTEKHPGWTISKEKFFNSDDITQSLYFFSFIEQALGHDAVPHQILSAGLYLEIYFSDTFYKQAPSLAVKIKDFLKKNNFIAASDIFIVPIENHWLCQNTNNYINKLFLKIDTAK